MKKIYLLSILFVAFSFLNAQNITLSDSHGSYDNDDTVTFSTDANTSILSGTNMFVSNNSASFMNVKVKKKHLYITPGSYNSFCWGQCYDTLVYVSPSPILISAGATNNTDFTPEYYPNGNVGTSFISYTFYNVSNVNDSATIVYKFIAEPVSVKNITKNISKLTAFPNPAKNETVIEYSIENNSNNLELIIKNMLGSIVYSTNLNNNNGKISINTLELNDGIYFYSILSNRITKQTKKLIVKH